MEKAVLLNGVSSMFQPKSIKSFTTHRDGRKLFHPWGPTTRPRIVPDESTFGRLQSKMQKVNRTAFYLSFTLVGLYVSFNNFAVLLIGSLLLMIAIVLATQRIAGSEIRQLERISPAIFFRQLVLQLADRESSGAIAYSGLASIGFVLMSAIGLRVGFMTPILAYVCMGIFGLATFYWTVIAIASVRRGTNSEPRSREASG